ncbi:membrane protein [Roseisolibacter agri]|uniref:Membrane protein n=1 Tax=Roseisolibacter agri TaxID=2014610 RepID=A0AA37QE83_9BACT|nr:membrane protein [Roseisolibacter agri]
MPPAAHARLRQWARTVKRDVLALWFAARDPRVPWYAKALALVVAGYALSPIDLIPDFIPVLGYLDDVILVPAGILLVRRLIPAELLAEHRALAERAAERPTSRTAALVIVVIWIAAVALTLWLAWPTIAGWVGRGPRRASRP